MAVYLNQYETSVNFFPTVPNFQSGEKAGRHIAQLIEQDSDQVYHRTIHELRDYFDKYHLWLWAWSPRYDVRAIVEINDETRQAKLIAVMPKAESGYSFNLDSLWKKYRTRRNGR